MTRYRKKPVEVEAWQVGTDPKPLFVKEEMRTVNGFIVRTNDGYGVVTDKGIVPAYDDDYIVMEGMSTFSVYPPGEFEKRFEQTYEVVE